MNNNQTVDTPSLIRTKREVSGISATLLPFTPQGEPDWDGFRSHVSRTADAGLTPAVNMDTGYINLLDDDTRLEVLAATRDALDGRDFVAGTFVGDSPGDALNLDEYRRQVDMVQDHGGAPVVFQSYGMTQQGPEDILASYSAIGRDCPEFIAFELGTMFAPFGQIYDLETYAGLLDIPQCTGAKHSSLDRSLEWERLALRDERRPNFKVYTGNDLGIDMIIYGSDYLLGLSTFAPEHFALRDAMWASGALTSTRSTTCSSTWASSHSETRSPRTNTAPRSSSRYEGGSTTTPRIRATRSVPAPTSRSSETSPNDCRNAGRSRRHSPARPRSVPRFQR